MLSNYTELFVDTSQTYPTIDIISSCFRFSTGFFLSLVRLIDPYYRFVLTRYAKETFGIIVEKKSQFEAKPLNSYLAASLNLELINIILQGICKFSSPDWPEIFQKHSQ